PHHHAPPLFPSMTVHPPRPSLFPYNDALPISRPMIASWRPRPMRPSTSQQNAATGSSLPSSASGISTRCASTPASAIASRTASRSEEHTSELQSRFDLVCRLMLEKKKKPQLKH